VLVLPFGINAADALTSVQASLPQLLADKLRAKGVNVAVEAGKGAVRDPAAARKLGAAARAEYVVYGSLSKIGDGLSLDARVAKVSGGEPVPVFATAKSSMALDSAAAELADKIVPQVSAVGGTDRIVDVEVEGNSILDKEVILLKIKSQVNQTYDPKAVNDACEETFRPLATSMTCQVRLDSVPGGKKLTFVVKEKPAHPGHRPSPATAT